MGPITRSLYPGLLETSADIVRADDVGKGNRRIMHPAGRSDDQDTPFYPMRQLDRVLLSGI